MDYTKTVSTMMTPIFHVIPQVFREISQAADPTAVAIIRGVGFLAMGVGLLIIALRIWRNRK